MDVKVMIPTEIGIASIDLTSILGNLLDNARIEKCPAGSGEV